MHYARLGQSNLKISRIALGAMGIGSPSWREWVLDEAASRPIVARALELGVNFIDTCDFYSGGESEIVVGRATLVRPVVEALLHGVIEEDDLHAVVE